MDFIDLVQHRQSVRRFNNKPIEKDKLLKILKAARFAPSACNSQPWHFVVVNEKEQCTQVAHATFNNLIRFNRFTLDAPVFVVVVMEKPKVITQIGGRIKSREYPLYDIGIVAEHICLQAAELNIGSCMIGWFDEKKLLEILKIPSTRSIGLVIAMGYPADGYKLRGKSRKKAEDIISFNTFQNK